MILKSIKIPPVGGDTCFSNMELAWETLDEKIKDKIKDKKAPPAENFITLRNFRKSPEVENFYRFISDNDLRREEIITFVCSWFKSMV